MRPAHAACDRRGSTSTTMNAMSVKKIAMMVQTAGCTLLRRQPRGEHHEDDPDHDVISSSGIRCS